MRLRILFAVVALGAFSTIASAQPDVIVGDLNGISSYGTDGSGIYAYSVGTTSCNIGSVPLLWISGTPDHPVIGQSMYRYKDGQFEHLGQSWLKHGFFALQGSLCGSCSPNPDGSALGVGCSDPYTSGRNGSQGGLGPKSEVNASNGSFSYPPSNPLYGATIGRRVQVAGTDLDPALNPGATYVAEAQYVTPDDASAGNGWNNASWEYLNINSSPPYNASLTGGTVQQEAAIFAWQDIDPSVTIVPIDVDGRIYLGYRVTDNGDGTWHYEYAIHNVNSHQSVRSFAVPVDSGVGLAGMGFHDVAYHSNEPYSGADWPFAHDGVTASWETESFGSNPNANALRWGTLYNFRFDADTAPEPGTVTLGMFRPGTPTTVTVAASIPGPGSGIAGPNGLSCSELNHDVSLNWSNGDSYDSVEIKQDGVVIASLPGSATSYSDTGVPVGSYVYTVRGFVSGSPSGSAICNVDVVGLPFPTGLTCADGGSGDVLLGWSNPFTYDNVRVRRDGVEIVLLGGGATSFSDTGLSNGVYHYEVSGIDGGNESQAAECDVLVLSGPSSGNVLVWDGPGANGATAVIDELNALGYTVVTVTSIATETLAAYDAVFACLGIFPANHVMSASDGQDLKDYVLAGGRVYLEGGDVWAYDSATAFDDVNGIIGISDGSADLSNLEGLDSGVGLDLSIVGTVPYSGENNWIDHLSPSTVDADICWTNADNADNIGIAHLPAGQGPVIGCSFQFAGIGGAADRTTTMVLYMDVFGLGAPEVDSVTGLSCIVSGSNVNLSWTNASGYDSVRVYRNGSLLVTLGGGVSSHSDSPAGGTHTYDVRGVIGSDESPATTCSVNMMPLAPTGLTCTPSGSSVGLSWVSGESYDNVEVRRDGTVIATLAGGSTSYTDNSAGGGSHAYAVSGVIDGLDSADATCSADVTPVAPSSLNCAPSGLDIVLSWLNGEGYDSVTVLRGGVAIATLGGGATGYTDGNPGFGSHDYTVRGTIDGLDSATDSCSAAVEPGFVRGEVNGDGSVNLADIIALGAYLFSGASAPSCLDGADVNDDGALAVDDMIYALSFIFSSGSAPSAPYPTCGPDPTADSLDCGDLCP